MKKEKKERKVEENGLKRREKRNRKEASSTNASHSHVRLECDRPLQNSFDAAQTSVKERKIEQ